MSDKFTWENTIQYIRSHKEYAWLVEKAYLEEDLVLNVNRFKESEEFNETLLILKKEFPNSRNLLDIGAGNGITSIAFALAGYEVTVVEPNLSDSVGIGAILKLKDIYKISNLKVHISTAEDIDFPNNSFDIVYTRQCMHHANNLKKFVSQASRVLKNGGIYFSVRDHVIFNKKDKDLFLENHPLQKFYGGENAFTSKEYKLAIKDAGLNLKKEIKYFQSVINFSPVSKNEFLSFKIKELDNRKIRFSIKFRFLSKLPFSFYFYNIYLNIKIGNFRSELKIPGRMYSYLAKKN